MAACLRKNADEFIADILREKRQVLSGESLHILW
jgi:hypothetical protein